jgi:hypothetical protein
MEEIGDVRITEAARERIGEQRRQSSGKAMSGQAME